MVEILANEVDGTIQLDGAQATTPAQGTIETWTFDAMSAALQAGAFRAKKSGGSSTDEIVLVTPTSSTSASVTRGVDGTSTQTHADNEVLIPIGTRDGMSQWFTDKLYSDRQAIGGNNEFKGWPALVADAVDLDAGLYWWRKVGTPTGGVTSAAISGETASNQPGNGLTASTITYGKALKCVAAASGDGLKQTWTFADEPRMKVGKKMSALVALWIAQSSATRTITLKLVNSDASEVSVAKQVVAGWNVVAIENLTLAGTTTTFQATADGAVTFYVVPLGAEVGATRARVLAPRGLHYVGKPTSGILNGVDPGGAGFTDVSLASATTPLTAVINVTVFYRNTTNANRFAFLRPNGSSSTGNDTVMTCSVTTAAALWVGSKEIMCDDGQILEYKAEGVAGDTELYYLQCNGYWEWN